MFNCDERRQVREMGLYKELDWWSITDMVDEIMEGQGEINNRKLRTDKENR